MSVPRDLARCATRLGRPEAGKWRLAARREAHSPKDGDVWSLRVADQGGGVVFEDERAVTYETVGDDCQRCKVVTVEF